MNTKIGWIGLGRMGIPMAQRLLKAGFPLTIYNRTKGKEESLIAQGALIASSPAQLMKQREVIFIMVSNDQAAREIFTSKTGLLNSGTSGKIIINMSTVSPEISREMSLLCKQQNNHYLDAPVAGSVKQAENGELVIMTGGEQSVFDSVKPILDNLGKLTLYVGNSGAGNIAKLAVNTLLGIISQGYSEAIVFAQNNGIKMHDIVNIISNSAMGSPYLKIKGEAILQDNFKAAFALKHIVKDLRLANESGFITPLSNVVYKTFKEAEPDLGEEDIISIFKKVEKQN